MFEDARTTSYKPELVLSVAWRLLTELYRRQSADHQFRLMRTHPGISVAGQLRFLVNPREETVHSCTQLALNLGGQTGTYEVQVNGSESGRGDFLVRALAGQFLAVVHELETAIGFRAPERFPPSTQPVLAMRLVAEVLTATWLDRQEYGIETAWFDSSGGSRVQPWAAALGFDVLALQSGLDSGRIRWESVYWQVAGIFRLGVMHDGSMGVNAWPFDADRGALLRLDGRRTLHTIDLQTSYVKHGRQIEPLAALLLADLRSL